MNTAFARRMGLRLQWRRPGTSRKLNRKRVKNRYARVRRKTGKSTGGTGMPEGKKQEEPARPHVRRNCREVVTTERRWAVFPSGEGIVFRHPSRQRRKTISPPGNRGGYGFSPHCCQGAAPAFRCYDTPRKTPGFVNRLQPGRQAADSGQQPGIMESIPLRAFSH